MINRRNLTKAFNPNSEIDFKDPIQKEYYIDFSSVRGSCIIEEMLAIILDSEDPTCQLFSGHTGIGKSTELIKLKENLENEGFFVVYFESTEEFNAYNVEISNILLATARQVSESLESVGIQPKVQRFQNYLQGAINLLTSKVEGFKLGIPEITAPGVKIPELKLGYSDNQDTVSLSVGIGELTLKAKDSQSIRDILDEYIEPNILELIKYINEDLLDSCNQQLKAKGKQGLVVIIDNLDRIAKRESIAEGFNVAKKIFVEQGRLLKSLNCHLVYTMPIILTFANELQQVTDTFGVAPKRLPMVQVTNEDNTNHPEGIEMLKDMVLARAFPDIPLEERKNIETKKKSISRLFESLNTLDIICQMSGGHIRNLLILIFSCIPKDTKAPPFKNSTVRRAIVDRLNDYKRAINKQEWKILDEVAKNKKLSGFEENSQSLLQNNFIYEYQNEFGTEWYDINPILNNIDAILKNLDSE